MLNPAVTWLGLSALMILTLEVGFRSYLWFRVHRDMRNEEGASFVMSAALTLLALLVGFTFGMAQSNFELRRDLVTAEANAISTTHLRHQLLDEASQREINALMAEYVKVRMSFSAARGDRESLESVSEKTANLQKRIWEATDRALETPAGQKVSVPLLTATNEMFDDAERRYAAFDARIPDRILRSLLAYALGSALLVGLTLAATGARHFISTSGLFLLIGLALSLIIDMDNGAAGLITTSQAPMERVAAVIDGELRLQR
jgi:hypothetical protein